ncbi:MAG: hypothetical protein AB9882_10930 [Ignavibacteriaceae bacterium]
MNKVNLTKIISKEFSGYLGIAAVLFILFQSEIFSQYKDSKDAGSRDYFLFKENTILDRAGGTHNASNIGLFFENRGKLYPRRLSQGPSGEFPINSGKHYIYRINPMVGIPNNVVQGRYTTNEEWEAVGGYHNNQGSRIAFSDNTLTWHPVNGWPVKDKDGNPVIKSDQDSYCVYSDSLNNREVLGITVAQTGYAYGIKFAQNLLFFKYDIINNGKKDLTDLYFNLYSDIDIGDVSGGLPEYGDDKLGFDKQNNFVYFFDDGVSGEWPDGKTGHIGIVLLQTPKVNGVELGITDMHYNVYNDDRDVDSIQYYIMSSSPALYNHPLGPKYFHIGSSTNFHYDDPATIPASGLDLLANLSSGPYVLKVGDTLSFLTAVVAGETYDEMYQYLYNAKRVVELGFELSKPPATPEVSGFAGDRYNIISWDDAAEKSKDNFSGEYDFEGYRLYRSIDKGVNWKLLADFDIRNDMGIDRGLQYSYTDTTVNNGFEYWYSVTAYDRGDSSVESLESSRGKTPDAKNNVVLIPVSMSIGRTPVSAWDVKQSGAGVSNYEFKITPFDDYQLAGNEYQIGFNYTYRAERGVLHTRAYALITDSSKSKPEKYGMFFKTPTKFDLVNMTTGENILTDKSYIYSNPKQEYTIYSGFKIKLIDSINTPLEFLPQAGDLLTLDFSVYAVRNQTDTVIYPRGFLFEKPQSTSDGIAFEMHPPEIIQNWSKVGGTDNIEITFTVADPAVIKTNIYLISTTLKGFNNEGKGFVSLEVKDTSMRVVLTADTVYTLSIIEFEGISAKVDFPPNNPPQPGNIFSLETLLPITPNIRDKFTFKIKDAFISSDVIREKLPGIKVVPNPYVVSSLFEPEFGELRMEPLRQIQFINLPPECTIYIFTMDADIVKTINHTSTNGTATWDLRAEGGREIAPGIYIYVVKSSAGEYKDKFAIIK